MVSVGSILTFASIVGGCAAAVRYQMWRIERMDAASAPAVRAAPGSGPASTATSVTSRSASTSVS